MKSLLKFLIGNAWKFGETYDRLQAFNQAKAAQGDGLIPLEPYPNWLEGVLQALLVLVGFCLVLAVGIEYSDKGFSRMLFWFLLGFGVPCAILLLMLFNTDSRYVLDMKGKRVIYVFTFFTWRSVTPVTTFTNVKSIELDAKEVGRTAAGNWQYCLCLVKKTFERIPLTRSVYFPDALPAIGQLIAQAIQCPFKEGERQEKLRIMGL